MKNHKKGYLFTIFKTPNYGGYLQAYALYKFLKPYFTEFYIVDVKNKYLDMTVKKIRFTPSIRGLLRTIKDFFLFLSRNNQINKIKKRLKEFKIKEIKDIDFNSIAIVGSDQLWNPEVVNGNSKFEKSFLLTGLDFKKKISISTSFGSFKVENLALNYQEELVQLSSFENIALRESNTAAVLGKILSKDIFSTLDPTLLHNQSYWHEQAEKSPLNLKNEKYILIYGLKKNKEMLSAIKEIRSLIDLPVYSIDSDIFPKYKSNRIYRNIDAFDFLKLIKNADYVITNSFHGVAFSVNLGKNFCAVTPEYAKNRVLDFLSRTDNSHFLFPKIQLDAKPKKNILKKLRDESKNVIKNFLE